MEAHTHTDAFTETDGPNYGPRRLIVELTDICNLHCSYCLRDEGALYDRPAHFFSPDLLRRVLREAKAAIGVEHVMFTGGETTLHPRFRDILAAVGEAGLRASFVTNGWHFDRIWPTVMAHRAALTNVAFSLDGDTREAHDRWRGEGSFDRLVRAFARCFAAGVPFMVKVGLRRDTAARLQEITFFAARMGAAALAFGHLLPTTDALEREHALSREEREEAEREIAALNRIFKMSVTLNVGYDNLDPAPPCSALAGVSCNIDYRGRLTLCCNLSGYRGAGGERDVVADLNTEEFGAAYARLQGLVAEQLGRRRDDLARAAGAGEEPDQYLASPCLHCLVSFGKIPWRGESQAHGGRRSLTVLGAN